MLLHSAHAVSDAAMLIRHLHGLHEASAAGVQAKLGGEAAAGSKAPKPASRPASAAANHATPLAASAAAAVAAGQAAHAAGLSSAEAALGNIIFQSAQGMEQVALTPEEDKIPLAMMAGITPAKAPRVRPCSGMGLVQMLLCL